jgi:hypothetical protein
MNDQQLWNKKKIAKIIVEKNIQPYKEILDNEKDSEGDVTMTDANNKDGNKKEEEAAAAVEKKLLIISVVAAGLLFNGYQPPGFQEFVRSHTHYRNIPLERMVEIVDCIYSAMEFITTLQSIPLKGDTWQCAQAKKKLFTLWNGLKDNNGILGTIKQIAVMLCNFMTTTTPLNQFDAVYTAPSTPNCFSLRDDDRGGLFVNNLFLQFKNIVDNCLGLLESKKANGFSMIDVVYMIWMTGKKNGLTKKHEQEQENMAKKHEGILYGQLDPTAITTEFPDGKPKSALLIPKIKSLEREKVNLIAQQQDEKEQELFPEHIEQRNKLLEFHDNLINPTDRTLAEYKKQEYINAYQKKHQDMLHRQQVEKNNQDFNSELFGGRRFKKKRKRTKRRKEKRKKTKRKKRKTKRKKRKTRRKR